MARSPSSASQMNRMFRSLISGLVLSPLLLDSFGCATSIPAPIPRQGEPIGIQLLRAVPDLKDERFSTLLDFESNDDAIFCDASSGNGAGVSNAIATDRAHTGRSSCRIDPSATRFTIKLSSLLAGRQFPGEWTLVGGYFYSESPARISVSLEPPMDPTPPRQVELEAGKWTAVFVEVPAKQNQPGIPSLVFNLPSPHGAIWCDDVMLIDNYKLLTSPPENSASQSDIARDAPTMAITGAGDRSNSVSAGVMPSWTVERRGLNFLGSAPGRFNFELVTTQASATGWTVDEANPMRARFHSPGDAAGSERSLTIYADGRAFLNGEYKPMSIAARDPMLAVQHLAPAQIQVAEGMGRVDRNTPGDANNDGYNETTGSYRILATAPRIELRFTPTKSPVLSPILEFSGFPFGKALVTLEGRLIEQSTRTSTGTLLVELPAKIDRPVTVNVTIEE